MDTKFTLRSHAFFKETTLPCQAGWRDVSPLFMRFQDYNTVRIKSRFEGRHVISYCRTSKDTEISG